MKTTIIAALLAATCAAPVAAQTFKSQDGITWGYDYNTHRYRPVSNLLPSLEEQRLQAEIDNLKALTRRADSLSRHEDAETNQMQSDVNESHHATDERKRNIP
jgi:hypothetical protein